MVIFSQHPLQKSIYQILVGDAPLLALVTGIYDRPVQGTVFPYVAFGTWQGRDWSSMTTNGLVFSLALEVWSREGGHKQSAVIMERIHTLLHDVNPAVDGQVLVSLRFISSSIALEDDGCTYRGILTFRAMLQA